MQRLCGSDDLSPASRSLAYFLSGSSLKDNDLYMMVNACWEDLLFTLQERRAGDWHRVVDTSLDAPADIAEVRKGRHFLHLRIPELRGGGESI